MKREDVERTLRNLVIAVNYHRMMAAETEARAQKLAAALQASEPGGMFIEGNDE